MIALMQRSDEELYRLMKKGNQDAFAQLYARRAPALRRYALHISGSPAVAEEVSHEVFLQLMGALLRVTMRAKGSLESFLLWDCAQSGPRGAPPGSGGRGGRPGV